MDILTFLKKAEKIPVVDVRTPAEFTQGHIPGAINIPLFSDEERKMVGTTYKQTGQKEAVLMGLGYAGPKMKDLAVQATELARHKQLLVHCWRGGMRSASMSWLFNTVGLESLTLDGGYKTFRSHVLDFLERDFRFIVIGGLTGSGKTDILDALGQLGEQTLDLEKLARHKGSAFGGLGEEPQNTNEQFENEIFSLLNSMSEDRIIWVEDESRMIGKNTLPAGTHRNIRSAPLIFLDVDMHYRVKRLVEQYAKYPVQDLCNSVDRIRPRLGDRAASTAIEGISRGNFEEAIEIVLRYYDKTYLYGLNKREKDRIFNHMVDFSSGLEICAEQILEYGKQIF